MDIREPDISPDEILFLQDDDFNLDHVIMVTGAGRGIGRAAAIAAAANNLMTIGLDMDEAEGRRTQELAREIGGQMIFIKTDLTRDEECEKAVEEAAKLGTIKYLINIAGVQYLSYIEDFPLEQFDFMHRLMVRAPFLLSKLTIPHMKKSHNGAGVIGHMASINAHVCPPGKSADNISKFSLRALSQSISAEGGGKVRSFTISPGMVKAAATVDLFPARDKKQGIRPPNSITDVLSRESRTKEFMSPIEVGNLFLFGISRFAGYLVGSDLLVDGGMVLTYADNRK